MSQLITAKIVFTPCDNYPVPPTGASTFPATSIPRYIARAKIPSMLVSYRLIRKEHNQRSGMRSIPPMQIPTQIRPLHARLCVSDWFPGYSVFLAWEAIYHCRRYSRLCARHSD